MDRGIFRNLMRQTAGLICFAVFLLCGAALALAQAEKREPVTISVVVANPSKEKSHTIPIKIDLPQEVKPEDILEKGELEVQYDDQKSSYFLFNQAVLLKPEETRVFNVLVKNVWIIPNNKLSELKSYTKLLMGRLEKSEYAEQAKKIAESVNQRLDEIDTKQRDESVGQKQRIGAYRYHLQALEAIKQDLEKMEKLLTFQGGPPVPEMLQQSKIKSDAPSTKTTWMIILSIVAFISLLGFQFFFTWHRRAAAEKAVTDAHKQKLPGSAPSDKK